MEDQAILIRADAGQGVLEFVWLDRERGDWEVQVATGIRELEAIQTPSLVTLYLDGSGALVEVVADSTVRQLSGPTTKTQNQYTEVARVAAAVPKLTWTEAKEVFGPDWLTFTVETGGPSLTVASTRRQGGVRKALEGHRERAAKERSATESAAAARNARKRAEQTDVFVNPYTFVPVPMTAPDRKRPAGHASLAPDSLSGVIEMQWKAVTPLLLRNDATSPPWLQRNGSPLIPGSSIKGAVRSLHETLTGSCYRVIDLDYVPVYREHAATSHRQNWKLAVVEAVDVSGRPTNARLLDGVAWLDIRGLGWNAGPATGQRLNISGKTFRSLERDVFEDDAAVEPHSDGEWVILVTTGGARQAKVGPKRDRDGRYCCAVGKRTDDVISVSENAWSRYLQAVDDAGDVLDAAATPQATVPAQFEKGPTKTFGKAFQVGRRLAKDQVIWVDVNGPEADRVSLAALWRAAGDGPVSTRLGPEFHPCSDPTNLCASCRIFGSADVNGADDGAPQRSYRSHIRFSDATATDGWKSTEIKHLAPLGQPRPGSGQFYLQHGQKGHASNQAAVPTRQWGSQLDKPNNRPIAGRKYYWRGGPTSEGGHKRHEARDHQKNDKMTPKTAVIEVDSIFTGSVHFEGLSRAELGGLLAALVPSLALSAHCPEGYEPKNDGSAVPSPESVQLSVTFGGGKPFGLGEMTPSVTLLAVHNAAERYLGANAAVSDADAFTNDAVKEFEQGTHPEVIETWPDLAAVLRRGYVNDKRIWYPPAALWDRVGSKDFDESYHYFTKNDGRFVKNDPQGLVTLARPREANQYLDIIEKKSGKL